MLEPREFVQRDCARLVARKGLPRTTLVAYGADHTAKARHPCRAFLFRKPLLLSDWISRLGALCCCSTLLECGSSRSSGRVQLGRSRGGSQSTVPQLADICWPELQLQRKSSARAVPQRGVSVARSRPPRVPARETLDDIALRTFRALGSTQPATATAGGVPDAGEIVGRA
jgi:hypothetical protein